MVVFSVSDIGYRILVTGSRGKSSLVRLIFAGISAAGLNARGRITGVLPRELLPGGERLIVRNSPGHIEEMRWWLKQIPNGTDAVIMENSGVSPELQPLAARWLKPSLIVLTNAREDHQEIWGRGREAAEDALLRGIPEGVPLVIGGEAASSSRLREILERRRSPLAVAEDYENFRLANLSLAKKALEVIRLSGAEADRAMELLRPDVGDFRIFFMDGGASLAAAFSANDVTSTELLFSSLGWKEEETTLLFSDRPDRPERRVSFGAFFKRGWREVIITGINASQDELCRLIRGKQVFGCGNIAGAPLGLLQTLIKDNCKWIIPGV